MFLEAEICLKVVVVDEDHALSFPCVVSAHCLTEHYKFTDATSKSKITLAISEACFPAVSCVLSESEISCFSNRNLACMVLEQQERSTLSCLTAQG